MENEKMNMDLYEAGYSFGEKVLELFKDVIRNNIDLEHKNDEEYLSGLFDACTDGIDNAVIGVQEEFHE